MEINPLEQFSSIRNELIKRAREELAKFQASLIKLEAMSDYDFEQKVAKDIFSFDSIYQLHRFVNPPQTFDNTAGEIANPTIKND